MSLTCLHYLMRLPKSTLACMVWETIRGNNAITDILEAEDRCICTAMSRGEANEELWRIKRAVEALQKILAEQQEEDL